MVWFVVVLAGVFEIAWAQSIKASEGFTKLWPSALATGLTVAVVYALAVAMRHLPTGTVYVVFTGMGALGTALIGILLREESTNPLRLIGLCTVVVGVTLLYLGDSAGAL
jgi:quaternary ammonium compound-resistance protein SugE